MNVKEWLKATKNQMDMRQIVIDEAGTNLRYMRQLSSGNRSASPTLSKLLVKYSEIYTPQAVMTLVKLRPDIWDLDEIVDDAA